MSREPLPSALSHLAATASLLAELTKARLATLVVVTTAAGFVAASTGPPDVARLAVTLAGTALAAAGAMALNQWIERERDGRMVRTRARPLPSGRVSPPAALVAGLVLATTGIAALAWLVNPLTAALGLAVVAIYTLVYTPLKTRTTLCTMAGAVCGALPPVMGWTAAGHGIAPAGIALGAVLFVWQIPHFLALAWMYREDYERGGFRMLPSVDRDGTITSRMVLLYSLALLPVAASITAAGGGGPWYAAGSFALGAALAVLALRLVRDRSDAAARRVFVGTLGYLPLLLALLVFDRPAVPRGPTVADGGRQTAGER